jgi:pyridoxal 5'-phosphate synthase pdxS subunit
MIRTKGEAGTGNVVEAVRHQRTIMSQVRELKGKESQELMQIARKIEAPLYIVKEIAELQRLPVINFAAGGIATPADAALMMQLGSDGVFVGSGIFKSDDPEPRARAIVEAVTNFDDPKVLAEISKGLGEPMKGIEISTIKPEQRLQERGW